MEAIAARKAAIKAPLFETSELTTATSLSIACAVVITSTVTVLVAMTIPSLTTREMEFVPTGKTTIATTPVARGSVEPARNQPYCNVSPSTSEEREPFSTAVALVLFGERTRALVALGSDTGTLLAVNTALELVIEPKTLVTRTAIVRLFCTMKL